jgi:16S rRNA (uracil1498-N3)-methyltransferase
MRIYLQPELINRRSAIILPQDKSRHLITVMRCKIGEEIIVTDGMGKAYVASISSILNKEVRVDILREIPADTESRVDLVLCPAVLKGEKMDMVIQKATELGVREIIPLITERCQVRVTRKTDRWRKIAEESVEQCGRSLMPVVQTPVAFADFIREQGTGGLIFMENGGFPADEALDLSGLPGQRVCILIGPEGGFSPAEAGLAEQHGFIRATLGCSILRAETAAIASVALIRFFAERRLRTG